MILKLVPVQHITKAGIGFGNVMAVKDEFPYCMFPIEMLYEPSGENSRLRALLDKGKTVEVEARLDIVDEEGYE